MNETDRALVSALIERIVPGPGELYRLLGPIAPSEYRALCAMAGAKPDPSFTPVIEIVATGPPAATITLDTRLLHVEPPTGGCLCFDFGTAASKVGFEPGGDLFEPLEIGEQGADPFWVRSAVAIDRRGHVVFGTAAVAAHAEGAAVLTSFKSKLWGDPAVLHSRALSEGTISFSFADAIQAYLAYLTRLTARALAAKDANAYLPRRYAMPFAYDNARRSVRALLGTMLGRAAVLADTLGDELIDGVPAERMRAALDAASHVSAPAWLLGEPACVGEPVAAGSFALHDERTNLTVYMIVDVGAGTTDFCILCLKHRADGEIEPIQIANGALSVEIAGDAVDAALVDFLVEQVGEEHRLRIRTEATRWKETLFAPTALGDTHFDAYVGVDLVHVSRQEFLASRQWQAVAHGLRTAQAQCFDCADREYLQNYGHGGIRVVLTGGGVGLPLNDVLASGRSRGQVPVALVPTAGLPLGLRDRFARNQDALPRLAVALGGARDLLPRDHDRSGARTTHGHSAPHVYVPLDKTQSGLNGA